jgi:hypothetical protein
VPLGPRAQQAGQWEQSLTTRFMCTCASGRIENSGLSKGLRRGSGASGSEKTEGRAAQCT